MDLVDLVKRVKDGLRNIQRQSPCPHEEYETLGGGHYVRCTLCGTIPVEALDSGKEAADIFQESMDDILEMIHQVEELTLKKEGEVPVVESNVVPISNRTLRLIKGTVVADDEKAVEEKPSKRLREPTLVAVMHFNDVSFGGSMPCSTISYLSPSGRPETKTLRNAGHWTDDQARLWLKGKYRPRVSNLFGLLYLL